MAADLPDLDALIHKAERDDRRRSLQLGVVLIAGGIGLSLATHSLFGGQLVWVAPATLVVGAGLIVRGLKRA